MYLTVNSVSIALKHSKSHIKENFRQLDYYLNERGRAKQFKLIRVLIKCTKGVPDIVQFQTEE